jgi:hypothetical protein
MTTQSTFKFELDRLPPELTTQILSYLPKSTLHALAQTNGALHDLISFHPTFQTHPSKDHTPSKPHQLWNDLQHSIGETGELYVYTKSDVEINIYGHKVLKQSAVYPPLKRLFVRLRDKDLGLEVVGTGRRGIVTIEDVIKVMDHNADRLGEGTFYCMGLHHCQGRVYGVYWESEN